MNTYFQVTIATQNKWPELEMLQTFINMKGNIQKAEKLSAMQMQIYKSGIINEKNQWLFSTKRNEHRWTSNSSLLYQNQMRVGALLF